MKVWELIAILSQARSGAEVTGCVGGGGDITELAEANIAEKGTDKERVNLVLREES